MKKHTSVLLSIIFFYCFLTSCIIAQNNRVWATYYGGNGGEYNGEITTDALGNVYVVGNTSSISNISFGGFQNNYGGGATDAYLVKFDANGNRLWATYYGGTNSEYGNDISVDLLGNVYIVGETKSSSGIASFGFQNFYNGGKEAFIVKFDANGNRLWASYYGGTGDDVGNSVTTDNAGNVYLAGATSSSNNIAFGGFQNSNNGGFDTFIVKFNSSGNRIWASYYGGNLNDEINGMAADVSGEIYITGITSSNNLFVNGFQSSHGGGFLDAFIVKFNPVGNLIWSSYYGGPSADFANSVSVDPNGAVYICGLTSSSSNIAFGGFLNNKPGTTNAFLVKFDINGNRLWATYYGDTGGDHGEDVVTDNLGNVYLAGGTASTQNIALGGFQNSFIPPSSNLFIVKFDTNGNRLCSTYLGNDMSSIAVAIVVDVLKNLYVLGVQLANNGNSNIAFNGFQNFFAGGGSDSFIAKLTSCNTPLNLLTSSTNASCSYSCDGVASVNIGGGSPSYAYQWNTNPPQYTQTATGLCEGTYTITVSDAANTTSTAFVTINSTSQNLLIGSDITITQGASIILNSTAGWLSYSWNPNAGLNTTTNNSVIATPDTTTKYCVVAINSAGCKDTACITINVEKPCPNIKNSTIPNAFSPNGDNVNDEFCIQGWEQCIDNFTIRIFNRWGEKVFESNSLDFCWDGIYQNQMLDAGVFVYYINAKYIGVEKAIEKKGNISLIR